MFCIFIRANIWNMATASYNDLTIVHRYLDEVTTFIQAIVQNECAAILLACQIFEDHKKREDTLPFPSEEDRRQWLCFKSRFIATEYLNSRRFEEQSKET